MAALFWFVVITSAYNFVGLDPLHVMWSPISQTPHHETPAHGAEAAGMMGTIWEPGANRALSD